MDIQFSKLPLKPFTAAFAVAAFIWWLIPLLLLGVGGCSASSGSGGCSCMGTPPTVTGGANYNCGNYCGAQYDRGTQEYNDCMNECIGPTDPNCGPSGNP